MIINIYGYQEPISNCNCIYCVNLRKISEQQNLSLDEIINIENNILVKNETLLWRLLYQNGYNEQLELKTFEIIDENKIENNNLVKLFQSVNIDELSLEILLSIFQFLDTDVIITLGQAVPKLKRFTKLPEFNIKRELICFYTKESFENEILGYGINIKYFKRSDQIQSINVILDLVSKEAYDNKCNHSVWNEEFRFWLPININKNHINRARNIIEQVVADIYFSRRIIPNYLYSQNDLDKFNLVYEQNNFKSKYFLDIICKILSSMVVDMMKDNIHASVKALNGFCEFHYLLLQFIEWYPELVEIADQKIKYFISNYRWVNKNNYHSLGEFIILLLVSKKFKWNDVKHNFFKESEVRNIRWILREIPDFETNNDLDILDQIFEIVNVGKKLNLFTIYFINQVALKIQDEYSFYYGRLKPEIEQEFQEHIKKIKSISNWEGYYQELNIYLPPKKKILLDYKNALNISKIKKYHKLKQIVYLRKKDGDKKNYLENKKKLKL